jgi:hypothetical protein
MPVKKNIPGLTPGTWAFRFRPKANDGRIGEWSGAFNYTVVGDIVPPPVPSKPAVESVMGGVYVKWVESLYATPIDFNRVDVHVSSGGAYTKVGSIATINGGFTYSAPDGVTGPFTFKFTGVDRSGNVSAFSVASNSISVASLGIDTEPPTVPSNLSVTAANDPGDRSGSSGYATVSFTPSSSADLLGHYIRYGTNASALDNYDFLQKGQNSKVINGLRSGQIYYFQVNATDGSNPSAYIPLTPVSATIPGDAIGPAAPTGLVAVAGFNNIVAYWNRNTESDVDLGRGTYQFQLSTSNTFSPITQDRTITGTVASFTGLTTGTTYYVRVRAIDSSANVGGWSATATAVPGKINGQTSITDGTIVGDLIAANTIVGDKLITNTIDADRLKTNTGIVGKLFVGNEVGSNNITIDGTAATPALYYGTGTYNNANTAFYFDALGRFSLKDQLTWNGSILSLRGSLNVTQASTFTGNVTLNSGGDLILNGGAIRATGSAGRVEIGSLGVYGYNATSGGTALVRIDANTGQLTAQGGTIGGWTINQNSLTTTNTAGQTVGLYSNGQLYMGPNFSVGANGSVTVSGTINVVGTGSNVATSDALTTGLAGKVAASEVNSNVTSISGGVISTGTINLNNVNIRTGTGGSRINIDSTGLKIFNSAGTPTVSLNSDGSASFLGTITGSTGRIGGWDIGTDTLTSSSGGTVIRGNGKIYIGTDGDDALTLSEGSNLSFYASSSSKSSINFYRTGYSGSQWDTQFSQTVGGNMSFQGNTYGGDFPYVMFIRTFDYSGADIRSFNNGVSAETLKVTRVNSSASANTTDLAATTQIFQFYKSYPNNFPQTSWTNVAIGGINARNATTAPAFYTGSDERLKKNIELYSVNNFINDIKDINVYKYHDLMVPDEDDKSLGFLAKEFYPKYPDIIQGVPDAIDEYGDPEYMKITRENLVPHMFAAIKYLVSKVEDLEERLNAI